MAKELGLEPIRTPICNPQSNDIADSFLNTFKRDYVSRMNRRDARAVLSQLAEAFEHFNEIHPHSALRMQSPREFRRGLLGRWRHDQSDHHASPCE
jgi:putative transposase